MTGSPHVTISTVWLIKQEFRGCFHRVRLDESNSFHSCQTCLRISTHIALYNAASLAWILDPCGSAAPWNSGESRHICCEAGAAGSGDRGSDCETSIAGSRGVGSAQGSGGLAEGLR